VYRFVSIFKGMAPPRKSSREPPSSRGAGSNLKQTTLKPVRVSSSAVEDKKDDKTPKKTNGQAGGRRGGGATPKISGKEASKRGRQYEPVTSDLEKKRLVVADELNKVEQQIFDLETKYLEQSTAFGNAIRGYEGFLGGIGQANKRVAVKPEDRIFSSSFHTSTDAVKTVK
jgi:hypothetical protein